MYYEMPLEVTHFSVNQLTIGIEVTLRFELKLKLKHQYEQQKQ